ncbi:hypothetical protein GWK08_08115 [Leptobacterium flavescens]|uniref:Uncharacterized protein n=1 Tax=Leptobacterium flavescens TaxID=472055 RepID=A0A6P0UND6_9FLAO|nr:hypothetical protein [Leptobacterium flavescens]NER13398.1 hypothetical protein [Leptobacterium flavescens]
MPDLKKNRKKRQNFTKKLRRFIYIILSAWMIGISNVIYEEDRMVNDTRSHIEQREETPDDAS